MRGQHLGDSYDLVKRAWSDSLGSIGPLYAHPRFVPVGLRAQYTAVTSIPILDLGALPGHPYGVLLDPHTGIPLPDESVRGATASHASLPFIVEVLESLRPAYMVCFDQSHYRQQDLTAVEQRDRKRRFLQERGISSFYYRSHAPFLFVARSSASLGAVQQRLLALGIPPERFESAGASGEAATNVIRPTAEGRGGCRP